MPRIKFMTSRFLKHLQLQEEEDDGVKSYYNFKQNIFTTTFPISTNPPSLRTPYQIPAHPFSSVPIITHGMFNFVSNVVAHFYTQIQLQYCNSKTLFCKLSSFIRGHDMKFESNHSIKLPSYFQT